tara:strand:+ start:2381 stop:3103 length:723 start_codon:yes stop_codon:yes gene_type:complete
MATFLELVNEVNRRLNEVELTTSNFASSSGFYAHAKDAVNASIRYINQSEFEWPFNHNLQTLTLTANQSRYAFPADTKVINFDSFRIREDATIGNATTKLSSITYEEYLDKYVGQEYNSTSGQGVPVNVVQAPSLEFVLTPEPDKAYELIYEYYNFSADLVLNTDTTIIPDRFKHVITDGAMHYAYLFRGNTQDALVAKEKFDEGIKHMRSMLINRTRYVRSYMIPQNTGGGSRYGFSWL